MKHVIFGSGCHHNKGAYHCPVHGLTFSGGCDKNDDENDDDNVSRTGGSFN